jgi:2-polyprenyl-3-methyl-5-hydroxy-6-metoxy-1,4-benzoquinol methylase
MNSLQAEIEFEKYRKRGAYHWENYFGPLNKIDCFLRARYDLVVDLLRQNGADSNSQILEIGCGDGALTGLIYQTFQCSLVGTEPSSDGIRFCKEMFSKHNFKGEFIEVGGYSLSFPDSRFDFIVLADVIEHLQQPGEMLKEIKRLLKPGGRAIITTPIRSMEHPEDKMHVHEFFNDELIAFCAQYFGKPIESIRTHPLVWHELYSYGKKRNRSLIRFYCRLLDKVFGKNVFSLSEKNSRWKNFKQQGLIVSK